MQFISNSKTPFYPPEIIDEVRQFDLEEVAQWLGMERDCHDKKKWRISGCTISIDPERGVFFDHLAQTGGGGAISLVTHVLGCDFVSAMDFLWGKPVDLSPRKPNKNILPKVKELEKLPRCNRRAPDKWKDVKEYLIDRRVLPSYLVDTLHQQGKIDADICGNVMFFRYSITEDFQIGEAVGASLRSISGNLKLLTPGTKRNEGWFFFGIGEGFVHKIFLVESPIDAISLAALRGNYIYGRTIYISVDGAGSIPRAILTQATQKGTTIILALDGDCPGEEMSWRIAKLLPRVLRLRPLLGKDWNEQLLGNRRYALAKEDWLMFVKALDRDELTRQRINRLVEQTTFSTAGREMFLLDWKAYRKRQNQLWQWYRQARTDGKSAGYLQRIVDIAISFNQQQPIPLSKKAIEAMQKDLTGR
ncbi:TOPRIM domain-containing protein (plasmid) [Stanieria cyanosphaera PCC 7437]|uniref:TOPRIM domain-containing protein n=1 Tax=Stanieria cyanosphaera (strain ATCC 29371 / PCC 7437) TaxID=111780 RepID=K9Y127_STAC7|nr:toprim domain-containing protein [Stanieria cyanosphaera]AFZ38076.1 TOPRIM domain-containing protein [Stanieria cyanosphaera PCC 7437]